MSDWVRRCLGGVSALIAIVTAGPLDAKGGPFTFHEGVDGFVEILAGGSKGLVLGDAVVFRRR